jgi:hypothetical protein
LNRNRPLSVHTHTPLDSDTRSTTDIATSTDAILVPEGDVQNAGLLSGWFGFAKAKLNALEQDGAFKRAVAWAWAEAILALLTVFQKIADWNYRNGFLRREQGKSPAAHALAGLGSGNYYPRASQSNSTTNISQQGDHEATANGTNSLDALTPTFPDNNENSRTMKRSRNPVPRKMLIDGNLDLENIRLDPDADSVSGSSTRPIQETAKSIENTVKLKHLFDSNITAQNIQVRMPTERPTLGSQRELERQRQCLAAFMDRNGQWHPCHVLFDTWCARDIISTALIWPLIDEGKVEELRVPDEAVEEMQNFLHPRLHALESYVRVPGFRFEHRKTEVIENKELYIITNEEPFIIFSHASMDKHGIRLGDLPKDERSSYLKFANLQFNAGVVKFEKGKHGMSKTAFFKKLANKDATAPKEDKEHKKKSQAKHIDVLQTIQEDKNAEAGSSTSTQTTWGEETAWSYAATSSQDGSRSNGQ